MRVRAVEESHYRPASFAAVDAEDAKTALAAVMRDCLVHRLCRFDSPPRPDSVVQRVIEGDTALRGRALQQRGHFAVESR